MTTLEQALQEFIANGYSEIATDSGTGSRVLVNAAEQRVVKLNQDGAYAKFVDFCIANPALAVPRFFSHAYPLGPFGRPSNEPYSIAKMELLVPLAEDEESTVVACVQAVIDTLRSGGTVPEHPDDPFELRNTFQELLVEARRVGASLDVSKSTNFLKRIHREKQQILFSDPFN